MTTRLTVAFAALSVLVISGCSGAEEPAGGGGGKSSGSSGKSSSSGENTSGGPVGSSGGPVGSSGSSGGPTPPAPAEKCNLPTLTAAPVTASFLTHEPGVVDPPAQKGGKTDGQYTIDKATVYLPSGTKGLVKIPESSGTVTGWAIFKGDQYRLALKADLKIKPIIGAIREQPIDSAGAGTFKAEGAAIKLLTACPGTTAPDAEVSFSENGARATLVVMQAVEGQGDAYLLLEAKRGE